MGLTQVNSGGINDNSIVNADLHSAANIASTKLAKPIDLADNEKVRFGTGSDLQIYHDGTHSRIDNNQGDLFIQSGNVVRITNSASSETAAKFFMDGACQFYHDNNQVFTTMSGGVNIIGELECDSLDVDGATDFAGNIVLNGANYNAAWDYSTSKLKFNDNAKAAFGTSSDLQIYHDGTENRIVTDGPNIRIGTSGENFAKFTNNGAVDLYYDNSRKFSTATDGVSVVGNLGLGDGGVIQCGQNSDLRIQHSGSNSFIETSTSSTGDLYIVSQGTNHDLILRADDDIFIQPQSGEAGIKVFGNGGVELFYDGQMRFQTNSSAVTMRGGGEHRCEGHFRPWANNTYDLGTNGDRWRNVYTNDLHLSNEGSTNDIDGTWGSYTIQEGEDDLFLINRRSGKKYKFNLTEVN